MLLPYTCQKQICPSNATYKTHMPISSCVHMTQLCQYIYLIWTKSNQQCDQEHWYTYISNYWHMSLNIYVSHMTHICPTALLLWSIYRPHSTGHAGLKKTQIATYNYHTIANIVPETNMSLKCYVFATHANYFICRYQTTVFLYIPYMNSMQSTIWPQTLLYIHSHYWHMPPEQICCHIVHICATALLLWSTYRTHITI